jgi:hypothetical protein
VHVPRRINATAPRSKPSKSPASQPLVEARIGPLSTPRRTGRVFGGTIIARSAGGPIAAILRCDALKGPQVPENAFARYPVVQADRRVVTDDAFRSADA